MKDQKALIEKGLQLAAKLPDIMPEQASAQIKPLFEEIKHTLRVPLVNMIFRTLANYPEYLESLWRHFAPGFCSNSFEQEADNLREKALLELLPEVEEQEWADLENADQLRAFNDTIFYVLPKLLLIATAFHEATFRSIPERRGNRHGTDEMATTIPTGIAEGTAKVSLIDPDQAPEIVKNTFAAIKQTHAYPMISSYYRGISNWPNFLQQVWGKIKKIPGTSEYESLKAFLAEQATNGLRRLPLTLKREV